MSLVIKKALTNFEQYPTGSEDIITAIASFIHSYGVYLTSNGILNIKIGLVATSTVPASYKYSYIVSAPDEQNYGSFFCNLPDTMLGPEAICNLLRYHGAKVAVHKQGDDKYNYYIVSFAIPE